ncbi:MAG: GGDEF domain-containing protein [Gammaproteobacteria bacterium]|nr:GGDEF domain-containing protein [Gammaproteobacteria bacterium]
MEKALYEENNDAQIELKRCISRLSYVGMGLSKDLDGALNDLRKSIKSDENENVIKSKIDKIGKVLLTLEDKKQNSRIEKVIEEVDILGLLIKNDLPPKLKSELKREKRSQDSEDIAVMINGVVNAINRFLDESQNPQASKPGFFARLFGGKSENTETTVNQPQGVLVPDALKDSLKQLVERLMVMDANADVTVKLTERVYDLSTVDELPYILELITGAFVEFAGKEQVQFESFLKSLNNRIDSLAKFINKTQIHNKKNNKETAEFDANLKGSVSDLQHSIGLSDDLEEVKQAVNSRLESMVTQLETYVASQKERNSELTNDIDILQDQLRATKDETVRLKDELAAQKMRAQTDQLTQLPNRYSYNERLTQEYNRWRRYRSPLSLVVGDIDFFKQINDTHGHEAGDKVLRQVASYLQSQLRESDFIARFGGEEFIILLPETNMLDATKAVNKIRLGVKNLKIRHESHVIQLAMSFGVSEFENNDTPKAVFEKADKALYRAKDKGRDQVCCQRN